MIRINLLPDGRKKQAASGSSGSTQMWAGIYLLVAVLWMVGLAAIYYVKTEQLSQIKRANRELSAEITRLLRRTDGLDELQAQLDRSMRLEEVVGELNRARTGPLRAVMELSKILSQPGGPTIDPAELERQRQSNPYADYTVGWDVQRLWVEEFSETERECTLKGKARSNDDVAEFMRRLTLSELFEGVVLVSTQEQEVDGLMLQTFHIGCRVVY